MLGNALSLSGVKNATVKFRLGRAAFKAGPLRRLVTVSATPAPKDVAAQELADFDKRLQSRATSTPGKFTSSAQILAALRAIPMESCELIVGVDFTKSNTWTGARTFDGLSLHDSSTQMANPYEASIAAISRTLESFDDDHLIPAYGFGDVTTSDRAVFHFNARGAPCDGLGGVLKRYRELVGPASGLDLSGPTSFAPIIREAIKVVKTAGHRYHLLVIVADGQVADNGETEKAIAEASAYPLSILIVGVGDGPWEEMERMDDNIPKRHFDNVNFVAASRVGVGNIRSKASLADIIAARVNDEAFLLEALVELPAQFTAIRSLRLLGTAGPEATRTLQSHNPAVPRFTADPPAALEPPVGRKR